MPPKLTSSDHTSLFLHVPSYSPQPDILFSLGHSCPFTSALTSPLFVILLAWTQPKYYSATATQCYITLKAQSKQNLSQPYCSALHSQTPISALAYVRETVHEAKCLNPPLLCFCCLSLAIPPCSLSAIYIWVAKFFNS